MFKMPPRRVQQVLEAPTTRVQGLAVVVAGATEVQVLLTIMGMLVLVLVTTTEVLAVIMEVLVLQVDSMRTLVLVLALVATMGVLVVAIMGVLVATMAVLVVVTATKYKNMTGTDLQKRRSV